MFLTKECRLATFNQMRALMARDEHCQWPGCDRTRRLKAHHIKYFSDHGPTALWNLALLCQKHHGLIHNTSWGFTRNAHTGEIELWRPDGKRFDPGKRAWIQVPDPPPEVTRPRRIGTNETLTHFAADVYLERWLHASGFAEAA